MSFGVKFINNQFKLNKPSAHPSSPLRVKKDSSCRAKTRHQGEERFFMPPQDILWWNEDEASGWRRSPSCLYRTPYGGAKTRHQGEEGALHSSTGHLTVERRRGIMPNPLGLAQSLPWGIRRGKLRRGLRL